MPTSKSELAERGVTLVDLPKELISLVMELSSHEDILSLRCTCKALNKLCIDHHGSKHFYAITTDLSKESLESLHATVKRSEVSRFFRSLKICAPLHANNSSQIPGRLGSGYSWNRSDENHLTDFNIGSDILRRILLDYLKNCRAFILYSVSNEDDFEFDDSRHVVPSYSSDWLALSDALAILFNIAAKSGMSIQALHALPLVQDFKFAWHQSSQEFARSGTKEIMLDSRRLPISHLQSENLKMAWASIEDLEINAQISTYLEDFEARQQVHSRNLEFIRLLFKSIVKLRNLSIALSSDDNGTTSELLGILCSGSRCANLTKLSLAYFKFPSETISRLLSNCEETLKHLELLYVTIASGNSWRDILEELKSSRHNLRILHFLRLRDGPGTLLNEENGMEQTQVYFQGLVEENDLAGSKAIDFKLRTIKRPRVTRVIGVYYDGLEMAKALDCIARSIITAIL